MKTFEFTYPEQDSLVTKEQARALPIAREIGRTYYGRAFGSEDGGQLPGFFSLKT